jgi:hypothetical protein
MVTRSVDPTGGRDDLVIGGFAAILAAVFLGGIWISVQVGDYLDHVTAPTSNPLRLTLQVFTDHAWTPTASKVAAALAVVFCLTVAGVVFLSPTGGRGMRHDP